ncbi:hypothetical protein A3732_08355 [Oleiphilus sp. HI0050]|nr:hypothetical protein A3732_08355 [Oleiphilus sp. HI0050]
MSETKLNHITNRQKYNDSEEEVSLSELFSAVWGKRWVVIFITSVFTGASLFYALNLPNQYQATAILAPASSSSSSSLSKMTGQLGGLASLAGINIGRGGGDEKTLIALEVIKAWDFLEKFIENNELQVEVFAAKGWSRSTNSLIIEPSLYDINAKEWVREFDATTGKEAKPSSWELFLKLRDKVTVKTDKTSGLVSLSVEHYSPYIAKSWVDLLVAAVNLHVQQRDRRAAIRNIEYLKSKINETKVSEMQTVFYQLIEEQTKKLMLAEVSDGYVFDVISPAKIPEEKSKPRRGVIVILATLVGGVFSVLFVLFRFFYSNRH